MCSMWDMCSSSLLPCVHAQGVKIIGFVVVIIAHRKHLISISGHLKVRPSVFHTESLLLRQADGGSDSIWGGKVMQSTL